MTKKQKLDEAEQRAREALKRKTPTDKLRRLCADELRKAQK